MRWDARLPFYIFLSSSLQTNVLHFSTASLSVVTSRVQHKATFFLRTSQEDEGQNMPRMCFRKYTTYIKTSWISSFNLAAGHGLRAFFLFLCGNVCSFQACERHSDTKVMGAFHMSSVIVLAIEYILFQVYSPYLIYIKLVTLSYYFSVLLFVIFQN